MPIDVIDAVLRVVLDGDDGHRLPERAVRQPLDDLAQRQIVVRDACLGRTPPGARALGVIVREDDQHEVRHGVLRFPLAQMLEDDVCLHDVGYRLGPTRILAHQRSVERWNVGSRGVPLRDEPAEDSRVVRLRVSILRQQRRPDARAVPWRRRRVLAEDRDRLAFRLRRFPQEPARRIRERIDSLRRIAAAQIERPHRILGLASLREPVVPVGRIAARREEMVEQHELLGERMRVRRDVAPVLHERAVARPLADVAEHLVVGAVLAHDVDDMIDE